LKIAVIGKGGSGKTTVAAIIARSLASRGRSVIALDCDTNPNLGLSLGFGLERTNALAAIRQSMDDEEGTGTIRLAGPLMGFAARPQHAATADELLMRFGDTGPDGLRLAVVSKIEKANPGCP
jgi:CO dehydrogenase maturation factor